MATRWAGWGSGWGVGRGAGRGQDTWGLHSHSPPPQDGSLQCPTCKAIYGEKTGTQPPGKMEFHLIPHSLPGFADTQTIRIVYDIPTGIQVSPRAPSVEPSRGHRHRRCLRFKPLLPLPQGPEHPNPGKKFTARGFPRHCYLPNNEKGRKVGAVRARGCGSRLNHVLYSLPPHPKQTNIQTTGKANTPFLLTLQKLETRRGAWERGAGIRNEHVVGGNYDPKVGGS